MKRIVLTVVLALGLVLAGAPAATPAGGDAKGPPCADITNGDAGYNGIAGGSATLDFTVSLAAPNCSIVTYSFFVTDTAGNPLTPSSSEPNPTCTPDAPDGGCFRVVYDFSPAPSTLCVYATTSIRNHLVDRAPDTSDASCPGSPLSLSIGLNGGGAQGSFG